MPAPIALKISCNTCDAVTDTFNGYDPDGALECSCCPEDHSHAGLGCRTITITAYPA
jgi:hypothetical protein